MGIGPKKFPIPKRNAVFFCAPCFLLAFILPVNATTSVKIYWWSQTRTRRTVQKCHRGFIRPPFLYKANALYFYTTNCTIYDWGKNKKNNTNTDKMVLCRWIWILGRAVVAFTGLHGVKIRRRNLTPACSFFPSTLAVHNRRGEMEAEVEEEDVFLGRKGGGWGQHGLLLNTNWACCKKLTGHSERNLSMANSWEYSNGYIYLPAWIFLFHNHHFTIFRSSIL